MLRVAKHRTLGLAGLVAAVAMLAVASVGVASASAATPDFKICAKVAVAGTGAWEDSKCSVADKTNEFVKVTAPWVHIAGEEWCAPVEPGEPSTYEDAACTKAKAGGGFIKVKSKAVNPLAFTSTSGAGTLETVKARTVKCTADTNEGELTGARSDVSTIKFTGCTTTKIVTLKCQTTGAKEGEIVLKVQSLLVYTNETTKEVSELLRPAGWPTSTEFVTFECTGLAKETLKVRDATANGGVLGVMTPTNTVTNKFTLTFSQSKGVQKSSTKYFEEGVEKTAFLETEGTGTEAFAYEQSAEETTDTLTTSELGEIKA